MQEIYLLNPQFLVMQPRKIAHFITFLAVSSYALSIRASSVPPNIGQRATASSLAVQIDPMRHLDTRPPAFEQLPSSLQKLFRLHGIDYKGVKQFYIYQVGGASLWGVVIFFICTAVMAFLFVCFSTKTLLDHYAKKKGGSKMIGIIGLLLGLPGLLAFSFLAHALIKSMRPGAIVLTDQELFVLSGDGILEHVLYEDLVGIEGGQEKDDQFIIQAAPGYGRSLREAEPNQGGHKEIEIVRSLMKNASFYTFLKQQLEEIMTQIAEQRSPSSTVQEPQEPEEQRSPENQETQSSEE